MRVLVPLSLILIFFLTLSANIYADSIKTYTNRDIDALKKSVKKFTPRKHKQKKRQLINGLPIEKREIRSSAAPKINYVPGKSLTVIGTKKSSKKSLPKESAPVYSLNNLNVNSAMLPYESWKDEYEEYFEVHYGDASLELAKPVMVTIRSLRAESAKDAIFIYKHGTLFDEGDDGLLYNHLSSHFIVDSNGYITQTLPLNVKSKGAFGVEYCAITIELTGRSSSDFKDNGIQREALLHLLSAVCEQLNISAKKVYSITEIAKGKSVVSEYTDLGDSEHPNSYSPKRATFGPSITYMNSLRKELSATVKHKNSVPRKAKK